MHKLFKRDWLVRMIWPGVISTRQLYGKSGTMTNGLPGDHLLLVILFGCVTFVGRRGETPNLTVLGKDPTL